MKRVDKLRNASNDDIAITISTLIADAFQNMAGFRFKNQNEFLRFISDVSARINLWLNGEDDLGKELENNGEKIIEMPCAIGEKLYAVENSKIVVRKVKTITWKGYEEPEGYRFFMTIGDYSYVEDDIGKTIFKTWKEAQNYLAKTEAKNKEH